MTDKERLDAAIEKYDELLARMQSVVRYFTDGADCPLCSCSGRDREEREAAVIHAMKCTDDCEMDAQECWCEFAVKAPGWWWE